MSVFFAYLAIAGAFAFVIMGFSCLVMEPRWLAEAYEPVDFSEPSPNAPEAEGLRRYCESTGHLEGGSDPKCIAPSLRRNWGRPGMAKLEADLWDLINRPERLGMDEIKRSYGLHG